MSGDLLRARVTWDLGDTEFEAMPYEQAIKAAGLPSVVVVPLAEIIMSCLAEIYLMLRDGTGDQLDTLRSEIRKKVYQQRSHIIWLEGDPSRISPLVPESCQIIPEGPYNTVIRRPESLKGERLHLEMLNSVVALIVSNLDEAERLEEEKVH